MKSEYPIVVIAGPTASGKSKLAVSLAKEINGYIINGDSRQVYKDMKIGTAQPKPDKVENDIWYIDEVKHFLYGYRDINNPIDISIYQKDVQKVLDSQKGIPILTGGTGLYIDCIVHNYDIQDNNINEDKRSRLSLLSVEELQELIDKESLNKLNNSDRNNPRRLIRILEGNKGKRKLKPLKHRYFVLDFPKDKLKERIIERVDIMFREGLEKEVKDLFDRYDMNLSAFNTIGYQEFREYFEGTKTLENVKKDIITHTNQYAKRQRTWFRKNEDAVWINSYENILQELEDVIIIL